MQKIVPHFWFDTQAKEAAEFYVSVFENSSIEHAVKLPGTPSGEAEVVTFKLAGQDFMSISAGPYFKLNPSISLFVMFESEEAIEKAHAKLVEGGTSLMEYGSYPWATKYAWIEDKYGLTWQLSLRDEPIKQTITPLLAFTQGNAGKAKAAMDKYTSLFPNSSIDALSHYEEGEGDATTSLKHARFTLAGQQFMAMDSSASHGFTFTPGISIVVHCDTQEEIDFYWENLSVVPEAEQCGWLADEFGVSWQIVPSIMNDMMNSGDSEKIARVTQAFLQMKKFDIATLQKAFDGQ